MAKMVSFNARSIVNKTTHLEYLLLSHYPHITETWLHENVANDCVVPPSCSILKTETHAKVGCA